MLKNEQANSLISRVSLESEIQSMKDKKHLLRFSSKSLIKREKNFGARRDRKKAVPQK